MLAELHLRDFVLVERATILLRPGLTVITGETGAGKSLLVDALETVLGGRAGAESVRPGAARAEIGAVFDLGAAPAVLAALAELDLDDGEACVLRRVIAAEGRSRAYVNGRPVTVQQLRAVGALLADIHGQHEHQSLLTREAQRELLDAYGGHTALAEAVCTAHTAWREARERLARLEREAAERAAERELTAYQVAELEALGLAEGEAEALEREQRRLARAEELLATCGGAVEALYEGEGETVHARLTRLADALHRLAEAEPRCAEAAALLEGAAVQIEEAVHGLRGVLAATELDPQRLAEVDRRLGQVVALARKHGVAPAELPVRLETLRRRLEALEADDDEREALSGRLAALEAAYREAAKRLSEARRRAAATLSEAVTEAMQGLGMAGGRFEVAVETDPAAAPAPHGLDRVGFLLAANPGQSPRPLARVASGGELSRIALALRVTAAAAHRPPTLVFDEVDVGIGGGVAEVVGRLLRALAGERQVLCVTHLPQVAAQGHHHLAVHKAHVAGTTRAEVRLLEDAEARVAELARMLGGIEITARTLEHARELMARAGA
ncbi:DNA repair protein RecN [Inmirania thermothiophila]|uniref:DNA repair protein RecN n=1 Tax=Inmirania thermothiophila TaxID=1750597 RepID=A0A3N1XZQ2_9GAMM|nr:DNA repair protein RecN [Inmirania thermothiophila]ROR32075.1 DNA replication and repair protein RecN [Inmirania thermothiophila]